MSEKLPGVIWVRNKPFDAFGVVTTLRRWDDDTPYVPRKKADDDLGDAMARWYRDRTELQAENTALKAEVERLKGKTEDWKNLFWHLEAVLMGTPPDPIFDAMKHAIRKSEENLP